jgi:hypothetical protein
MLLAKIVKACSKIDDYRKDMHELAMDTGLGNLEVLKISQKLDELINIHQQVSILSKNPIYFKNRTFDQSI